MLPWLMALGVLLRPRSNAAFRIAPWSAMPAILLAIFADAESAVAIPGVMLGMHLGLDEVSRVFLLLIGILWWLSGMFATSTMLRDPRRSRFLALYLLAMSGNVGLVLAQDMVTFYLFFALMSFSSYGLVVHDRSATALRAGRVYLVLVVVGEVLLFSGLALLAGTAGAIRFDALHGSMPTGAVTSCAIALLFLGLGIKVGILPLHVWLPLAHPAAPTPASAVLSGAMIKAGLIGWYKLLPTDADLVTTPWGVLFIVIGVLSAYYGALVGLTQRNPKTVLAYSSISQMGLITVGLGLSFLIPDQREIVWMMVAAYALHPRHRADPHRQGRIARRPPPQ